MDANANVLFGIFAVLAIAAAVLFFVSRVAWAVMAAFVAVLLLIFALNVRAEDKLDDKLGSLFAPAATQTSPSESPDDQGTCEKGDFTVSSTRGFCEEADGKFTLTSASNPQQTATTSQGAIPQGGGQNLTPTATTQSTPVPAQPAPQVTNTGSLPDLPSNASHGSWEIRTSSDIGSSDPIVAGWLHRLQDPAPSRWKTFPNIPNPDVSEFRVVNGSEVPDGVEYGTYDTPYCWSSPCDIPVGAWEYRYITGDYQFLGNECKGDGQKGCMLLLVNIMDASYTFRDQYVDNGFTLRGRYWNGDALEWGVWGLVSHGSANMLNMETYAREGEILNSGDPGNSGANCGTPNGCGSVDVLVVVHAGDRILATAHTVVTR